MISRAADTVVTGTTTAACVWCSSLSDVQDYRNEPRCGRCRELEDIVAQAREFVSFYGLRPLGGSVETDDDEERELRVAARDAYAELFRVRTKAPASRTKSRPASRPAAHTAPPTTSSASGSSGSTASGSVTGPSRAQARRTDTSQPSHEELARRAQVLLDQLTEIDAELSAVEGQSGLSARAKLTDLTSKRSSVLRTPAALEKASRAATGTHSH
ncbi:hypothetical protein [Gordonia jinhuaensis]|uniref:hypothetical protein n=1 Tax=Gordonia jinhuaensis TaxID=1517702 RepID=UPI00166AEE2B|nr:hypothetical protein [Gordonia jinhuaensis]